MESNSAGFLEGPAELKQAYQHLDHPILAGQRYYFGRNPCLLLMEKYVLEFLPDIARIWPRFLWRPWANDSTWDKTRIAQQCP